jgi:hypothetical protein
LRESHVGEIETEGLAIMAKDMGIECWGLPDLEIRHYPGWLRHADLMMSRIG